MEPVIAQGVMFLPTAKAMCDHLSQMYSHKKNASQILQPFTPDLATQKRQFEEFHVSKLLSGPDSQFAPVRNQLITEKTVPSVEDVFSRIQRLDILLTPMVLWRRLLWLLVVLVVVEDGPVDVDVVFPRVPIASARTTRERCWQKFGRPRLANQVATSDVNELACPTSVSHSPTTSSSAIAASVLGSAILTSSTTWVVDSGASDHMIGPLVGEEDWWWTG